MKTPMRHILVQGETPDAWSDELKTGALTGIQLKACLVALQHFSKSYPTAQLNHFIVIAKDKPDGFEVMFLPNFDNSTEHGSKTVFEEEVHYFVSQDKFEIIQWQSGKPN